ncbi:acetate--CoA ligase family protein [Bordetella sp. BOR01]|uniref:acetate--CoA ligase family protein n=1 Tax=Bordetella sp. BOR01 TaxID=2854779 RepID=UPI001C47E752|nr:acetate--CoA ligase family protein [Bordetella sp. BOR01]MBV7484778.1 acetate--CoA ligase family protein [Bordetella sp. BOR01]
MFDHTASLRAALDPRSIAVIGASENPNKVGGRPLRFLTQFGFKGQIYPINPTRTHTQGLRTWPTLQALPQAPELAIIAVAGQAAFDAIDACAQAGVKIAVVMTGGLTESDLVNGKQKERDMVARAQACGMRIIGPNSQGIANFGTGAIASFSTMFVEVPPADGPVGIVSQSGAMSVVPYGLLRQRGIGIRHSHATGNDCDVTACEMAAIVAEDPALKVLLLYLEGLPDPHRLAQAAAIARDRGLFIMAIKSGRTAAGQAAAQSHTGALASEDRVVDAFFQQHGILRAKDMREMVDGVELYLKGWRPRGRRLVAISTSGATCVMAADAAASCGLSLARLSDSTTAALRQALPAIALPNNPVDLTGAMLTDSSLFGRTLDALAPDGGIDAVLTGLPVSGAGYDVPRYARDAAAFIDRTQRPFLCSAAQPGVREAFRAQGVPAFDTETDAVQALGRFIAHWELTENVNRRIEAGCSPGLGMHDAAGGKEQMLDEANSLELLAQAGIPTVPHQACDSEESAVRAFHGIDGAVVLKGCSAQVAHKTELGLVRLNLRDEPAVRQAWREVAAAMESHGLSPARAVVAQMARGCQELMVGAHRDPLFGPVVVFGAGGKYVEAMPDVAMLLPPFARDDVRERLASLRMAPLLHGVRGEPALDIDAFIDTVMGVQALMVDPGQRLSSIDLNPVILKPVEEGCVAVDAVVYRTG